MEETLTFREWAILQQALAQYKDRREDDSSRIWWNEGEDGPPPSPQEIDSAAQKVGNMPHLTKSGKEQGEYDGPVDANGKPYITDVDKVVNALLLTDAGMKSPTTDADFVELEKTVTGWTDDQRAAAFEWAACSHLAAGDNDDVEVPPTPPHVEAIRPKYGTS